jgi:hypothetical protein
MFPVYGFGGCIRERKDFFHKKDYIDKPIDKKATEEISK